MKLNRTALAIACAAATFSTSTAFAQGMLEEVVVTAQKRAQSAQDIGITMSTMGGDDIRNLGVYEASGLTDFVPNMELSNSGDSDIPIFVVRGVGLQDYNTNNTPTTAVVVDDVYQPYGVYSAFSMFDSERVEILKGPQGGLYGRNSTGGAINFISRKPSFDEMEGDAAIDAGKYGLLNFRGGFSSPLGDRAALRIATQYDSSDGYYYNTHLRRDTGGKDKLQARLTLSVDVTDTLSADLRYTYGRDKSEMGIPEPNGWLDPNTAFGPTGLETAAGPLPDILGPNLAPCDAAVATGIPDSSCVNLNGARGDGRYRGAESRNRHNDDEFNAATLSLKWDIGEVTLDSITNFTTLDFLHQNNSGSLGIGPDEANRADWEAVSDATGRNINYDDTYITLYDSEMESWSQELRLSSNNIEGFNWMVGVVYAKDTIDELRDCSFGALLFADQVAFPGCGFMPFEQDTEATSIYGQVVFDITDNLTLTTDLRYTQEKKDYDGSTNLHDGAWAYYAFGYAASYEEALAIFGGDPKAPLVLAENKTDYDQSEPSWKVNLDYHAFEDTLLYANIGRSFKSGGFFGGFFFDPRGVESYDPETNTAYEAGFKSTLADNTVQLNGSVFFYDYKDFQSPLGIPDPASGATFSGLTNMGDVETYGAELDLRWAPIYGLDLRAAVGYLNTEIVKAPPGLGVVLDLLQNPVDVEGNELNDAPQWSANLFGRYDFTVTDSISAAVQADVSWTDDYWLEITNEPYAAEDGVALVNARIELYAADESSWRVAAWGKNLTDKQSRTATNYDGIFSNYSYWSAPRTYGVTLSYEF